MVLEISQFFDFFQDGRCPPPWILNFLVNRQTGVLICIAIPNFTKIGQTVAEIKHLTIFKMAAIRCLGVLTVWFFDQLASSGGLICAIMQHFVKISQKFSEISRLFDFQNGRRLPSWILKFLVSYHDGRPKMHHCTKFYQNLSNGCRDIAFNIFQHGGRPPSWMQNFVEIGWNVAVI